VGIDGRDFALRILQPVQARSAANRAPTLLFTDCPARYNEIIDRLTLHCGSIAASPVNANRFSFIAASDPAPDSR
jgi:hypothetical protein